VILHARYDVGEIGERVDATRLARRDERVQPGDAHARVDIADEEAVLTSERDPSQRALRCIFVEAHACVVDKGPSSRHWVSAYRIAVAIGLFGGCRGFCWRSHECS
jgi:hypothetical protein